jgi:N-acetylmuramoyl-L-alanine amidase
MIKVFLSAGHSNKKGKDQGAVVGGLTEGELAVRMRSMIHAEMQDLGGSAIVDDDSLVTAETVAAWRKQIGPNDIAVDLHFNASSNTLVEGVEVIVPLKPSATEVKLADVVSDIISSETGTPERGRIGTADGVKTEAETARKRLAWMSLPGHTILIEFQFMTDPEAMAIFLKKAPIICRRIASVLAHLQRESA